MTAPSLCLNFRALGRPLSLGRPIFRPSVHAGADECRSSSSSFALHRRRRNFDFDGAHSGDCLRKYALVFSSTLLAEIKPAFAK